MTDLCKQCIEIPRPIHFQRSSNFPYQTIGIKNEIKARKDRCPFCRLIYNAVFDNVIPYRVDDESSLSVIWNGEYYYFGASRGEDLSIKIAVIQEEDAAPSPANYSYARPVTGTRVDLKRIQSWLDLCREHHQQGSALQQMSVSAEPGPLVLPARVIDVQEGCIVSLRPTDSDTSYVTLSYVWGHAVQYKLLTANKDKLMTSGFLSSESIRNQLPQTICDAMAVVSGLGLRYLWVDALCIVQDDADDINKEIYRMDAIYEGSVFTLVAASGTHANAGLAVLHTRQGSQEVETIWPGVRMTALHDVEDILDSVKYGTRGWTFQEQVLSARIVVFTDQMAHFRCHDCTWSEDSRADETPCQRTKIGGLPTSRPVGLLGNPWMLYCTYLEQYSQRELTNEGDRVKAMMGILQRIRRELQCRLVDGLLSDAFEWGLNFYADSCQRCLLFPSYSWAGWKGRVAMEWPNGLDYEPRDGGSESDGGEFSSYTELGGDPDPESLWSVLNDFAEKAAKHVAKSTWIIWYERPPRQEPRLIVERDGLAERQSDVQALKTALFTKRARMRDELQPTQPTRHLGPDLETQMPQHYSILQFWTVSVKLRLRRFGVVSMHRANLFNANDKWCGQLRLPSDLYLEPQSESTAELILLSVTRSNNTLVENAQSFNGVSSLESGQRDGKLPQFYRVMWIRRRGDLAERVAVGEIRYSALRRPVEGKAAWKEIILS